MQSCSASSLYGSGSGAWSMSDTRLCMGDASVALAKLASGSGLGVELDRLRGRTALVWTSDQLVAALALIEIDGIVRRLVLCPPDLDPTHLPYVIATAGVDAIITDRESRALNGLEVNEIVPCTGAIRDAEVERTPQCNTEWILFTSGTTGRPKMVVHSFATLTGAIESAGHLSGPRVWATFYDVRRFGGLQILLRAVLGAGALVLSTPGEPASVFLARAKSRGVTHVTGTPSHWRGALMTEEGRALAPTYARLSGEIADQAVIDQLRSAFPAASLGHAFASTEAGVAFEVTDGRAGFPVSYLTKSVNGVDLEIENDTLRVRSRRTALRYLGDERESLLDAVGYVDTGDVIEQRGDRCYFVGRRGGIINVGGLKIHPEEVEAVINEHPGVRMSLVTARRNPITGSIVSADVMLAGDATPLEAERARTEIVARCRNALPAHKVPASVRIVSALPVTVSGKLRRTYA
jgi:acyl-coenzyme A synthetase/AMP-(fatty) acid ligase